MINLKVMKDYCSRSSMPGIAAIAPTSSGDEIGMIFLIERQPELQPTYVASRIGIMTLYNKPFVDHGVYALLSHARHSINFFVQAITHKKLLMLFPDTKTIVEYQVVEQAEYKARSGSSPISELKKLEEGSTWEKSTAVYNRYYTGAYPLVLQTCIEKFGNVNYGRLFLLCQEAKNGTYTWD